MALTNLAAIRSTVQAKLAQEANSAIELTDAELDEAIYEAVDLMSRAAPQVALYQVAGDGVTRRFLLSDLVTGWVLHTSEVLSVQLVTDVDTDDETVYTVTPDGYRVDITADDKDVLFLEQSFDASYTLRVTWTTPHHVKADDLDPDATTIPTKYEQAFYLYCVSCAAVIVAHKAANLGNNSLGVEQMDYEDMFRRWMEISKHRRKQADERLGGPTPAMKGAGSSVQWASLRNSNTQGRVSH